MKLQLVVMLAVLIGVPVASAPAQTKAKPARKSAAEKRGKGKPQLSASGVPISGAGPANEELDKALLEHIERSRCSAGTVAVMVNGELVYSRGYGWLSADKAHPAPADTPMRVASISKPITAAAVHRLLDGGKLTKQTKVFPLLKIAPPPGAELDPRWQKITVEQLLEHKGGWDIARLGFDPMFSGPRAAEELGLDHASTPEDMVCWMMTKPLSFDPGERSAYSNFGYCVLGRLIERVSRRPYMTFLRQDVLKPAGINPKDMWVGQSDPAKRDPREPDYNQECNVDIMDAHGGIVVSSPVLCEYLQHYWISGAPRKPGENGYVYTFFGSMPGTSAIAHQRADGINFACGFNGRHGDAKLDELTARINSVIDAGKN